FGPAGHTEASRGQLSEETIVELTVVLDIEADVDLAHARLLRVLLDEVRERRNARYLSSSSSSSAVRLSIAKIASLLRRLLPLSDRSRYPAFAIKLSYGTPYASARL